MLELTTRNWSPSIRATVAPGGTAWSSRSATSAEDAVALDRAQLSLIQPNRLRSTTSTHRGPRDAWPAGAPPGRGAREPHPGQRVHQQFRLHSPGLGGWHLVHGDHQGVEPALASCPRADHLDRAVLPRAHEVDRTEGLAAAGRQFGEGG